MIAMAHTLAPSAAALDLRGGNSANFNKCTAFSNASDNCSGANAGSTLGTVTTVYSSPDAGCGTPNGGATALTSGPYDSLASKIPASCPNAPALGTGSTVTWDLSSGSCFSLPSGNFNINNNQVVNVKTAPGGTIIKVTGGGNLVLGKNAVFQQSFGGSSSNGLTIFFDGSSGGSPGFVSGSSGSIMDFGAPTSGTWAGMAMYQNSSLSSSFKYTGNAPAFKITGIINAPYMNIEFDGTVNKQSNGYSCISFIVNTITAKGTGNIFATNPNSQCHEAGVDTSLGDPNSVSIRQALLQ
jgi:hypothetical protein